MSKNTPYTIVEPYTEFLDPRKLSYLDIIERAARTCHKSEDHMEDTDQKSFLNRICFKKHHYSVTDHVTCILDIQCYGEECNALSEIVGLGERRPSPSRALFALRSSVPKPGILRLSGNVKMWRDLANDFLLPRSSCVLTWEIEDVILNRLHQVWPFFFAHHPNTNRSIDSDEFCRIIDANPFTNRDGLSPEEMQKHMTLTHRLVGDRCMSHQLVRHRLGGYSQESQRWCDYGKKGFQFIIPPEYDKHPELREEYLQQALSSYEYYLKSREAGVNKEDARRNLPSCTKTEVVVTYTMGGWGYFHEMRSLSAHAEWQIRTLGHQMYEQHTSWFPEVFRREAA